MKHPSKSEPLGTRTLDTLIKSQVLFTPYPHIGRGLLVNSIDGDFGGGVIMGSPHIFFQYDFGREVDEYTGGYQLVCD